MHAFWSQVYAVQFQADSESQRLLCDHAQSYDQNIKHARNSYDQSEAGGRLW